MVTLENLTSNQVDVIIDNIQEIKRDDEGIDVIVEQHIQSRWRTVVYNSADGRQQLSELLINYPEALAEILTVWGDTPTHVKPAAIISIKNARAAKVAEVGAVCSAAIYAGIEVDGARYSLTEHDQIELMAQQSAIQTGAEAVPYHADGELCRMFPADEFMTIANAATAHIFYHRSYCNHLNAWIRRAETVEELNDITYGVNLPDDLAASMTGLIKAAGGETGA